MKLSRRNFALTAAGAAAAPYILRGQQGPLRARIKVDTDADGVVWLSGRAPTRDASDLAAMIAKNTEGVNSVHNDIAIEP